MAILFESRALRWCNEVVRISFGWFLIELLRYRCGGNWILRHSATEPGQYNIFFSDYDLTLIPNESWKDDDLKLSLTQYRRLKKRLKMIGEVEVYTPQDWLKKQELIKTHGPVVMAAREIRKIKWMSDRYRNSNRKYDQAKALRAIRSSRKKLAARWTSVQTSLAAVFENGYPPVEPFYSQFFQKKISQHYACQQHSPLKRNRALFLVATTVDRCPFVPWASLIRELRMPVLQFELLEHRSYLREQQSRLEPKADWLKELELEIAKMECLFRLDATRYERFQLHINNQWIELDEVDRVRQQESNRSVIEVLEGDQSFNMWITHNLYRSQIEVFHLREVQFHLEEIERQKRILFQKDELECEVSAVDYLNWLRADRDSFKNEDRKQIQRINPATVSFVWPLIDRFSFDVFLNFLLFYEKVTKQVLKVEICTIGSEDELLNYLKARPSYFNEFVKLKSKFLYTQKPSGLVLDFGRYRYPFDYNWQHFAMKNQMQSIRGLDFTEVINKVNRTIEPEVLSQV